MRPQSGASNIHSQGTAPASSPEPIAVVGMACKFPGAPDIGALWQLLERGGNAITEGVPGSGVGRIGQFYPKSANRLPACRFAALVDDIDLFDAEFFRISPVEAQLLDPQQRMVLETCWQALEDAGIDPDQLRGTRTGVYIGVSNNDYRAVSLSSSGAISEPAASLYTVAGTSFNTVAGRVAYSLGLEGPAISLDTACSSSLVAVHQAASVLRQGEADLVLVGGVQAIFSGRLTELRANAGMLSPDGQCKAFDASANGFVRGEGCGIVVLKRLRDAEAVGDPIWGIVLGSAINQDGASAGMTVPSASAQVKVIQEALDQAGVAPADVDYLEAHGTGTSVGDPIELNSAAEAFGVGRDPESPLLVGSIKTNVGHLEPTAGIAGLMKVLLSMQNGVIPKHLHFNNPNPLVEWDRLPVLITSENTDWPRSSGRPLRAAVSAYGWSGTNAHLIVEASAPPSRPLPKRHGSVRPEGRPKYVAGNPPEIEGSSAGIQDERTTRVLPLAAKSPAALADLAGSYLSWIGESGAELDRDGAGPSSLLADLAWSAGVGRSHFDFRVGVVFRDSESLVSGLSAVAGSQEEERRQPASNVAFVYTGQASQWAGMGEDLYRCEPVARAVLDQCDEYIRQERGESLLDVMFGRPGAAGSLDEPRWTQPAIFALESALTALWQSVGIRPSAVVGHSLGEIAAACAAGVLSLEDGLRFASLRGRLMGELPRAGAMAAVFLPAARLEEEVAHWNESRGSEDLCVAVDNGTHQVISGPADEVDAFCAHLEEEQVNVRRLRASPAYHSPLVEPALDDLEAMFEDVQVRPPSIRLISNVTGQVIEETVPMDGAYWRRHARSPVAFRQCVETLASLGIDSVIELGPHAILGPLVSLNWPETPGQPDPPVVLQSLLRPSSDGSDPERAYAFYRAVAGAYEAGLSIEFEGLFAGENRRRISLPAYPFQRRRHWVPSTGRRQSDDAHPLLGVRHESPRGEVMFHTGIYPEDPSWLEDHRVYGRVVMPGAMYGAMAMSVVFSEGAAAPAVEELQLHNPLVFPEEDFQSASSGLEYSLQIVIDPPAEFGKARHFEIFSREPSEREWTLHAEGNISSGLRGSIPRQRTDLAGLKSSLEQQDVGEYYRGKAATGIHFGPSFRTVDSLWCGEGEAVGEISMKDAADSSEINLHPLVLDGCFQVLSATRLLSGVGGAETYLPFAWENLRVSGPMPESLVCHASLRSQGQTTGGNDAGQFVPETLTGDLWFYNSDGDAIGELTGFTLKRATRASLLSGSESMRDLLYEMVWRERPLAPGMLSAADLARPSAIAERVDSFAGYLALEGVDIQSRAELLTGLERLSRSFSLSALEALGWKREKGEKIEPEELREDMDVLPAHSRLLERMLRLLADGEMLTPHPDGGYIVATGAEDSLPDDALKDPEEFADYLAEQQPHGENEIGLLRRSGAALAGVLRGQVDPLSILFRSDGPNAADFYFAAPASRASNRMLAEAVATLVANWPAERAIRILEVGAGTGSGTSVVLPQLPAGNFEYVFTDISAGFFSAAEERFADSGVPLEYRPLDIERNPSAQGFELHAYDLVIAVNVLHATRDLGETLGHCRDLLAPSGQLIAMENLLGRGWQDMTFGQLDGWWRFADSYRPHHALASPTVWKKALVDAGFGDPAVLGCDPGSDEPPMGSGVIIARGPEEIVPARGVWVLADSDSGAGEEVAARLAGQNQAVVLADLSGDAGSREVRSGVARKRIDGQSRESWRMLFEALPKDAPLSGVVHLAALAGHGPSATADEMAQDTRNAAGSALSMLQGLLDAEISPERGIWLVTQGAQVLEREYLRRAGGELAGASLWGIGKAVAREAGHLMPRMIDLDPCVPVPPSLIEDELTRPDEETHVAYRDDHRLTARLVRDGSGRIRQALPDDTRWRVVPSPDGDLSGLRPEPANPSPLEPGEVRVAVEAAGLNFSDVLLGMGVVDLDPMLGDEFCGRILEVAPGVGEFSEGERVVGLGIGTFRPDLVTKAEMVARAPDGMAAAALATIPTAFVTAELSYVLSGLSSKDRVLIHTASGGVGLAAIQLAQAAGAVVFATASAPKQDYLRSLGIEHVFNSRSTEFGQQIMEATNGLGVTVVLNSLTGPGFIEASLFCLETNGRFVELGRRDIWSAEDMANTRPDVAYSILEVDALKRQDPKTAGDSLRRVMARISAGELKPLVYTRWPMAEIGAAMEFMQSARHIGKNVIVMPPVASGAFRADRTYLVTGGLGGIGCVVADWLAERGAGTIVLNGRRPPDSEAGAAIEALQARGVDVRVELADVTDEAALNLMMTRLESDCPPIAGIIHSVGVLSDGSIGNQNWDRFEQVLWPKILGAWRLHRSTMDMDLDMFVLFSSVTGVLGNSGQTNHAAANAFLDQLAAYRRSLGLPGQSIAWGAWSGLGEAEEQRERIERQLAASGTGWISPQQGIRALDQLVRQDSCFSMVASVDWPVLADNLLVRPSLLEDLLAETEELEGASHESPDDADIVDQLREAVQSSRESIAAAFVQREVQAVLRLPSAPATNVGFLDLGMDSLMSVELRNRLNRALSGGFSLSNSAIFDYPTIVSLAGHIVSEIGDGNVAVTASDGETAPKPAPRRADAGTDAIAIVGMACRFPGAPDLDAFWRILDSGEDTLTDGRPDPGPWEGLTGDAAARDSAFLRGGFVEGIDTFDARFFRVSPMSARTMDPQQRMMLETAWHALEDAGISPDALRGSRTGVYVGVGASEYREVIQSTGNDDSYFGTTSSVTAGRVAFALGLEGPAMPVDMACASSHVAIHQAVVALQRGEIDMALAAGVNATFSQPIAKFHKELGMLSAKGRCNAFDAEADGFVRGEGCGVIVLKRLGDAEADGDRIWGIVKGSAVNQNGTSAALQAPNGPAQERVMRDALARAGVDPLEVDYLEAHGTGTLLGDAIELRALAAVYGRGRDEQNPLLVGSVKTNIGHLEWASGMAGVVKVILAMGKQTIPAHLNFENPNPDFDWDRMPIKITTSPMEWPGIQEKPQLAAVNSFGLSGANAHVVLEGYRPTGNSTQPDSASLPAGEERLITPATPTSLEAESLAGTPPPDRQTRLLPLSGKSPQALSELAGRYLSWLEDGFRLHQSGDPDADLTLADMAWTAGQGRSHFDYRAALVFGDRAELRKGLQDVAATKLEERDAPVSAPRLAFEFPAHAEQLRHFGRAFYESEPVVRVVLDRCNDVVEREYGYSLLDILFSYPGSSNGPDRHERIAVADYAMEAALTAYWNSVGVAPVAAMGQGPGGVAAAHAAGVLSVEDGIRIVAELSGSGSGLGNVAPKSPTLAWISGSTGQPVQPSRDLDEAFWREMLSQPKAQSLVAEFPSDLEIDLVLDIGACGSGVGPRRIYRDAAQSPAPESAQTGGWPGSEESTAQLDVGSNLLREVAALYEAGMSISFHGLFAGERRRIIGIPTYPFQRRHFWVRDKREGR